MKYIELLLLVALVFALSAFIPWGLVSNDQEQSVIELSPYSEFSVTQEDLQTALGLCIEYPNLEDCDVVMELYTHSDDFFEETPDKQYYNRPAHYDGREFNI